MSKIRLLLIDDHQVVRQGLRMMLDGEKDLEIVGEADSASQGLIETTRLKPDVVLMDIGLPDMSGIEATKEVKRMAPEVAVVALTIHESVLLQTNCSLQFGWRLMGRCTYIHL